MGAPRTPLTKARHSCPANFSGQTGSPFRSAEAKNAYLAYYDRHARDWPVASTTQTVETSFVQTFVRISGPADDPPMVLLPGDTEHSLAWTPVVERFSNHHRTHAVDQIYDIGRSD